jgi:hypothetical protein
MFLFVCFLFVAIRGSVCLVWFCSSVVFVSCVFVWFLCGNDRQRAEPPVVLELLRRRRRMPPDMGKGLIDRHVAEHDQHADDASLTEQTNSGGEHGMHWNLLGALRMHWEPLGCTGQLEWLFTSLM